MDIMRKRVDSLGVVGAGDPALRQRPDHGLAAGRKERRRRRAAGRQDRAAVLLRLGEERRRPRRQAGARRTSTSPVGRQPASPARHPEYSALARARRRPSCKPRPRPTNTPRATRSTASTTRPRRWSRPTVDRAGAARRRPAAHLLRRKKLTRRQGPPGHDHRPGQADDDGYRQGRASGRTAYYVLKDNPALRGADIKNPEQNFDIGAGGRRRTSPSTSPSRAARSGRRSRREIAQRGQRASRCPGADPRRRRSSTSRSSWTTS